MILYLLSITDKEDQHILLFIFEKYRHHMFSVAKSIVRDPHLAEDIVQETFLRIIKKMYLVKKVDRNALYKYTVLITRSIACNYVSKQSKQKTIPFDDEFAIISDLEDSRVENSVICKESVTIVKECLNEMGPKYSTPIILRYYYGYSNKETAEKLDIESSGTVRSICSRGRKLIKERIASAGERNE